MYWKKKKLTHPIDGTRKREKEGRRGGGTEVESEQASVYVNACERERASESERYL